MKKNKTMRIASVLLIAVLLTTSIISGTFAKYVTTGETTDHARVAKFGVVIEGEGALFAENYWSVTERDNAPSSHTDPTGTLNHDSAEIMKLTVESSNGDKVVAPGTRSSDDGLHLSVTGVPEVDVLVSFDLQINSDIYLEANGWYPDMTTSATGDRFALNEDYYPLVFTLTGEKLIVEGNGLDAYKDGSYSTEVGTVNFTAHTVTGTLQQIKNALGKINEANAGDDHKGIYVDANKGADLANAIGDVHLTWKWAFDGNQTLNGASFDANTVDKADTLLGDLAVGTVTWTGTMNDAEGNNIPDSNYSINVDVVLSATVTQVD